MTMQLYAIAIAALLVMLWLPLLLLPLALIAGETVVGAVLWLVGEARQRFNDSTTTCVGFRWKRVLGSTNKLPSFDHSAPIFLRVYCRLCQRSDRGFLRRLGPLFLDDGTGYTDANTWATREKELSENGKSLRVVRDSLAPRAKPV